MFIRREFLPTFSSISGGVHNKKKTFRIRPPYPMLRLRTVELLDRSTKVSLSGVDSIVLSSIGIPSVQVAKGKKLEDGESHGMDSNHHHS